MTHQKIASFPQACSFRFLSNQIHSIYSQYQLDIAISSKVCWLLALQVGVGDVSLWAEDGLECGMTVGTGLDWSFDLLLLLFILLLASLCSCDNQDVLLHPFHLYPLHPITSRHLPTTFLLHSSVRSSL